MPADPGQSGKLSPEAFEAECERLWRRARDTAKRTLDTKFGAKLLACDLQFRARMPLLRLISWAGLLDSQGTLLDSLREMRRLLDGAERPK